MKKTLLIAAAALAAGVITSKAQVYSQNIVGYVNLSVAAHGYSLLSNPMDVKDGSGAVNNAATNVFVNVYDAVNGGPLDGSALLVWNGAGYVSYYFDSNPADTSTGFTDSGGAPLPCPVLAPGMGFYFNNQSSATNISVVGAVRGATSTGVNYTNVIGKALNYYLVGSPVPLGGDLRTNLFLSNPVDAVNGGPLDGCQIQLPKYTAGQGNITGYTSYYFDQSSATGFTDSGGNPVAAPVIGVGQGFFFSNQTAGNYQWIQTIAF